MGLLCKAYMDVPPSVLAKGRQNKDTLWQRHCWRDHVSQRLSCFATCAIFVADTNVVSWTQMLCPEHKKCFWKSSATLLVSARHATMLLHFATDGQHGKAQCCCHNVSSFVTNSLQLHDCHIAKTMPTHICLLTGAWPVTWTALHQDCWLGVHQWVRQGCRTPAPVWWLFPPPPPPPQFSLPLLTVLLPLTRPVEILNDSGFFLMFNW